MFSRYLPASANQESVAPDRYTRNTALFRGQHHRVGQRLRAATKRLIRLPSSRRRFLFRNCICVIRIAAVPSYHVPVAGSYYIHPQPP